MAFLLDLCRSFEHRVDAVGRLVDTCECKVGQKRYSANETYRCEKRRSNCLFLQSANCIEIHFDSNVNLQHQQITSKCHENIKKSSKSLQLACLHLNINIYQRLIAVCFVLIHFICFLFALALIDARIMLKPLKSAGKA